MVIRSEMFYATSSFASDTEYCYITVYVKHLYLLLFLMQRNFIFFKFRH